MKAFVDIFQAGAVHMGVNLGCGYIGVPEHDLDGAKIGPMLEQMGGKGMADKMRTDRFIDAGFLGPLPNNLPETQPGHGGAPVTHKKKFTLPVFEQ